MEKINIIQVVLSVVSIIVTGILIPLVKAKVSKTKLEKAMTITDIAVRAAEQIFDTPKSGEEKYSYVVRCLKKSGLKLSDEEINVLVESAVKNLNEWQKELKK